MRFGSWRGVTLAIFLTAGIGFGLGVCRTASAGLFSHAIPRETLAYDIRTGGVSYAPPIPYGEYAKDYVGCITGPIHGLIGRFCMLCGKRGCNACGGLGHHNGKACGLCGGDGCMSCDGHGHGGGHGGLFHHGQAGACGPDGTACGKRHWGLAGLHKGGKGGLCGPGQNCASSQAPIASGQALACGQCQGAGCGLCGGKGFFKGHGGRACGLCGGRGLFGGSACGSCGGSGLCADGNCGFGHGANACKHCGGAGCAQCLGKIHGLLGAPHAMLSSLIHHGDVKYFVGPGGPVPITPGYVPYVVTTRSPRDYFAFPPFVETLP
jgi:hypothetical protein